jgi:hypothetical protein
MRRGQSKQQAVVQSDPQLQMFKNDLDRDLSLHEKEVDERAAAVTKIVTDLKDIQDIMKDLSVLAHNQGEIIGNSLLKITS